MKNPTTCQYYRILICSILVLFISFLSASAQKSVPASYRHYFGLSSESIPQIQYNTIKSGKASDRRQAISNLPFCDIYLPDTSSTGWRLANRGFYTYDSLGRYTSRTVFDLGNTPVEKDSLTRDRNNKELINANYKWHNNINNWVPDAGYKVLRAYLPNGKENLAMYQDILPNNWQYYKGDLSTYNAAGNLLDFTETYPANPSQNFKTIYTYGSAGGPAIELRFQKEVNGVWVNYERHINFTWYNFAKMQPAELTAQRWVNNAWEDIARMQGSFDSLGGFVYTFQELVNGNWENSVRNSVTIDAKGNFTGTKDEEWINGTWARRFESVQALTYNQNDQVTERIYRFWAFYNFSNMGWTNELKEVYYSNTVTGLPEKVVSQATFNIYPNPTETILNIEISDNEKLITAQLSDLTGKVVLKREFKTSEPKQLNLENLKPGIYFLHLQTDNGKTVRKIIKN